MNYIYRLRPTDPSVWFREPCSRSLRGFSGASYEAVEGLQKNSLDSRCAFFWEQKTQKNQGKHRDFKKNIITAWKLEFP